MELIKDTEHFVVGIGASAGGLEAYNDFFDNAKGNDKLSYILVQHLSPEHKSLLVELLSRHTKMRIYEVEDRMAIEPGCIYVIPPAKHLTVTEGFLLLSDKDLSDKSPNTSIDTFFYSLADVYEDRSIAVVLSGTGTDGSRGIEAIKAAGGLVIVQDPKTAKFDGMPQSSIATGVVDMVLPTGLIPSEILNYINGLPLVNLAEKDIKASTLKDILDILNKNTGCDFNQYKLPTVLRRLTRRLATLKISEVDDYLDYLKENVPESAIFCKDLLIGVTKFFRDKEAFKSLREKVLGPLIDSKNDHDSLKIWITACSTGEEVYTVAMIVDDLLKRKGRILDVKIFGTDLDTGHIEKAARGEYALFIGKEISVEYLTKYFVKKESTYTIIPEIRKLIVFAKHNVTIDPPFIKNDLICCRNMLIYMNAKLQKSVFSKFSFGLNPQGYLFLGSSETITTAEKLNFEEVDRKWKIYKRNDIVAARSYASRNDEINAFSKNYRVTNRTQLAAEITAPLLERTAATAMSQFLISGFYIDRNFIIQEAAGDYHKYLEFPLDGLKFNILKMLPDNISVPLNTAILKSWKTGENAMLEGLAGKLKSGSVNLSISIQPNTGDNMFTLLVFNGTRIKHDEDVQSDLKSLENRDMISLQKELKESKYNLQTAVEELETTNEELQSSNEELLSSNEELQSSNEELQSLNEELHSLSAEHQLRIKDLIELNDDLNNYFRASDIGQVIVNRDLKIRKFNPSASALLNLIDSDVSRPINHLKTNFRYEELAKDINTVFTENIVVEKEVETENNLTWLIRIFPFLRKGGIVDGALINFIDITGYKKLNSIINGVFEASSNAILALSAVRNSKGHIIDLVTTTSNQVANKIFGNQLSAAPASLSSINETFSNLIYNDLLSVITSGIPFNSELEYNGQWFFLSAVRMLDGVAITMSDLSERKDGEEKLRKSYAELYATKENLRQLNASLEVRVEERTRALSESEERFRLVANVTSEAIMDWKFIDNSLWASANFERLFGHNITNKNYTRAIWTDNIHPDDRSRVIQSINDNINSGNSNWVQEYRFKNMNDTYHLIHDRGYLMIDENGTPYRMLSSMLDITNLRLTELELKDSETRLELALDVANLAAWVVNLKSNKLTHSKMLPEIFGHEGEGNLPRESLYGQIHPDDLPIVEQAARERDKTGKYFYEARIIIPNGSVRWIETMGTIMVDESGKPDRMVGITRDITAKKVESLELEERVNERTAQLLEAGEDLKKINAQLSSSNSDLEQFAYIASHDLQEPLRKIQTFISLVSRKTGEEKVVIEYLNKISASAARMTSLIKNVLDFSRLSHGGQKFEKTDLNEVIAQLIIDFELLIDEKSATVTVEPLPLIEAIPHQVSQLFFNLISNALKYNTRTPIVRITSKLLNAKAVALYPRLFIKQKYVSITVADNGIGFDQQYAEKIFGFFYRVDAKTNFHDGNGIGLALCKKIVENHFGYISAKSTQGIGTEFSVILPLKQHNSEP